MKRIVNCAIGALVAAIGLSATATTMTPFDDCVWWFEGGVLTTGEKSRFVKDGTTDLFDLTHASTPDGATHQTTRVGADDTMIITNMEVTCPMIGAVVTQAVLHVSNNAQSDGKYYPATCTLPEVVRSQFTKNSAITIVGRVRVSPSIAGNSSKIAFLFDFGYKREGAGGEYYGFPAGFIVSGLSNCVPYYWTRLNDSTAEGSSFSNTFALDSWVDVAWIFKNGYVACAVCKVGQTQPTWCEKKDSVAHFGQGSDNLYFLRGNSGYTQGGDTANTAAQFKGDIARLAIWNRELTRDEVEYAFVYGGKGCHVFGLQNGCDDEFGGQTVLTSADANTDWRIMQQSSAPKLASGESFTYSFTEPISADTAGATAREMLVSFALTSASAAGTVDVRANGVTVQTLTVAPGKSYLAYVPGKNLLASKTSATANTVTLVRTDGGSEVIAMDCLAFTKGWQVGYADGSSKEFINRTLSTSSTYSLIAHGDWVTMDEPVCIAQGHGITQSFGFFVPPEVASKFTTFYTFAKPKEYDAPPFAANWSLTDLTLLVNGEVVKKLNYEADKVYLANTYTIEIPPKTLKGGYNTVGVSSLTGGTRGWINNDYFRFAYQKPKQGITVIFR